MDTLLSNTQTYINNQLCRKMVKKCLFVIKYYIHITAKNIATGIQKRYSRILCAFFYSVIGINRNINACKLKFRSHVYFI